MHKNSLHSILLMTLLIPNTADAQGIFSSIFCCLGYRVTVSSPENTSLAASVRVLSPFVSELTFPPTIPNNESDEQTSIQTGSSIYLTPTADEPNPTPAEVKAHYLELCLPRPSYEFLSSLRDSLYRGSESYYRIMTPLQLYSYHREVHFWAYPAFTALITRNLEREIAYRQSGLKSGHTYMHSPDDNDISIFHLNITPFHQYISDSRNDHRLIGTIPLASQEEGLWNTALTRSIILVISFRFSIDQTELYTGSNTFIDIPLNTIYIDHQGNGGLVVRTNLLHIIVHPGQDHKQRTLQAIQRAIMQAYQTEEKYIRFAGHWLSATVNFYSHPGGEN